MGVRSTLLGWAVPIFVMAVVWALMDMGVFSGITRTFGGKLIFSAIIFFVTKLFAKMMGG